MQLQPAMGSGKRDDHKVGFTISFDELVDILHADFAGLVVDERRIRHICHTTAGQTTRLEPRITSLGSYWVAMQIYLTTRKAGRKNERKRKH